MSKTLEHLVECLCEKLSNTGECTTIDNTIYTISESSRIEVEVETFDPLGVIVSITVNGQPRFRLVDDGSCECAIPAIYAVVPGKEKVKPGSPIQDIFRVITTLRKVGASPSEVLDVLVESGVPKDIAIPLVEAYFDFVGEE